MTRRHALRSLVASLAAGWAPRLGAVATRQAPLQIAPSLDLLAAATGGDLEAQLAEAARRGFGAVDDALLLLREPEERDVLADGLDQHALTVGTFLANSGYADDGLAAGRATAVRTLVDDVETAVGVAQAVGTVHLTIIPGAKASDVDGFGEAPAGVREAAELAGSAGRVLVVEALDRGRYPGILIGSADEAAAFCERVDHPACRVLFDAHQEPGPTAEAFDRVAAATAYVQLVAVAERPFSVPPPLARSLEAHGYVGYVGVDGLSLTADQSRRVLDVCQAAQEH